MMSHSQQILGPFLLPDQKLRYSFPVTIPMFLVHIMYMYSQKSLQAYRKNPYMEEKYVWKVTMHCNLFKSCK